MIPHYKKIMKLETAEYYIRLLCLLNLWTKIENKFVKLTLLDQKYLLTRTRHCRVAFTTIQGTNH